MKVMQKQKTIFWEALSGCCEEDADVAFLLCEALVSTWDLS